MMSDLNLTSSRPPERRARVARSPCDAALPARHEYRVVANLEDTQSVDPPVRIENWASPEYRPSDPSTLRPTDSRRPPGRLSRRRVIALAHSPHQRKEPLAAAPSPTGVVRHFRRFRRVPHFPLMKASRSALIVGASVGAMP